jgi:hypothetical protein
MPESGKLTSVPSVPSLGAVQVGQQGSKADQARDNGGTVDLKSLAFRVLQRSSVGQRWDSSGTEVSQVPVPQKRPVGQLQGVGGTDLRPEEWSYRFHQRVGFLHHDCGVPLPEAQQRAIGELQGHWRALHPLEPSAPEGGCIQCGGVGGVDLVPVLAANRDHAWVHTHCWNALDQARRSAALAALRELIPDLPERQA